MSDSRDYSLSRPFPGLVQRSLKLTRPVGLIYDVHIRSPAPPGSVRYIAHLFKKPAQSVGYGGRALATGSGEQSSPHSAANHLWDFGHCHLDHFAISVHSWLLCAFAPATILEELPLGFWVHFARKSRKLAILGSLHPMRQPLAIDWLMLRLTAQLSLRLIRTDSEV